MAAADRLFKLRLEAGLRWPAGPKKLNPPEGRCHVLDFWQPLDMRKDSTGSNCQPDTPTVHDALRFKTTSLNALAVHTETTCAFKLQMLRLLVCDFMCTSIEGFGRDPFHIGTRHFHAG